MSNPTTPFSWQMPTATDLVTDLPADFEVFGQAVATSMADLLGGTTGQILAKNSATDMDFIWTTPNPGDITGVTAGTGISGGGTSGDVTVTNTMATAIDAKGDLIVGTAADTFSRLAVGATNGHVLTVDSTAATGLKYAAAAAAGGLTKVATATFASVANTSTSFDGVFTSTYKNYLVQMSNCFSSVDGQSILIQTRVSGVTTTAGYYGIASILSSNAATTNITNNSGPSCSIGKWSNSHSSAGNLFFTGVGNSSAKPNFSGLQMTGYNNGPVQVGGQVLTAEVSTGFILSVASGNMSGTVTVYGLEN